jgi:hypothetical protein
VLVHFLCKIYTFLLASAEVVNGASKDRLIYHDHLAVLYVDRMQSNYYYVIIAHHLCITAACAQGINTPPLRASGMMQSDGIDGPGSHSAYYLNTSQLHAAKMVLDN